MNKCKTHTNTNSFYNNDNINNNIAVIIHIHYYYYLLEEGKKLFSDEFMWIYRIIYVQMRQITNNNREGKINVLNAVATGNRIFIIMISSRQRTPTIKYIFKW